LSLLVFLQVMQKLRAAPAVRQKLVGLFLAISTSEWEAKMAGACRLCPL